MGRGGRSWHRLCQPLRLPEPGSRMDGLQELGQGADIGPVRLRAVCQEQELPSQGLPEIGHLYVDAGRQGAHAEIRTMLEVAFLSNDSRTGRDGLGASDGRCFERRDGLVGETAMPPAEMQT